MVFSCCCRTVYGERFVRPQHHVHLGFFCTYCIVLHRSPSLPTPIPSCIALPHCPSPQPLIRRLTLVCSVSPRTHPCTQRARELEGFEAASSGNDATIKSGAGSPRRIITGKARETLEVTMWDKIEATPHGHYSKMYDEGAAPRPPRPETLSVHVPGKKGVVLDHYNLDRTRETLIAERPVGKKVREKTRERHCKSVVEA